MEKKVYECQLGVTRSLIHKKEVEEWGFKVK